MKDTPHMLSLLVHNEPGVLAKLAQLFDRRGHNIETLTVGKTHQPGVSKIVLSVPLELEEVEQLRRQAETLVDVVSARRLSPSQCLQTEVCLLRLSCRTEEDRRQILIQAQAYRPQLRDIDERSVVLEVAERPDLVDAFVRAMGDREILDVSRTGMTAIGPRPGASA